MEWIAKRDLLPGFFQIVGKVTSPLHGRPICLGELLACSGGRSDNYGENDGGRENTGKVYFSEILVVCESTDRANEHLRI
jgi:hypothetical protein